MHDAKYVTLNGATGTVSYEINGESNGCTLNGSFLTPGANSGTVTVNVTVAEDSNYNALAATAITVTIIDKEIQTITAEIATVTYGDTDKSVSANVTDPSTGGGAITYAVKEGSGDYIEVNASTGVLTIKAIPANGKAYVVVTAVETDTYVEVTKEVTVNLSKATPAVTVPSAKTLTYTGSAQGLVNAGSATGGTLYYVVTTTNTAPEESTFSTDIPTAPGTYYVWYKVTGDANHTDTTPANVVATIAPASITSAVVTLSSTSLTYNGAEQSVTVSSVMLGEATTLTAGTDYAVTSGSTGTNKGSYTLTVTGKGNYKDTATAQWSIAGKDMTATASDLTVTYGGQAHGITVSVTDPASAF